ncbi:hypothetical protein [Nocardioides sp. TF02-7]|uniref:hypothetical protein n=1 Tax=Nocardioides sp. TF02-7 TaxID=2917724 RepID=UPI001F0554FE|nr:hypothetical protein [Nocardioides sp. TF02-7]UMG91574.1 hypothetical protein MF408_15890 [Nocardioides sp. TF02-7]
MTGPPEAGGTLSSYVSPRFLQANAAFVNDPAEVARSYGAELRSQVVQRTIVYGLAVAAVGGLLLMALFRGGAPPVPARWSGTRGRRVAARAGYVVGAVVVSTAVASVLFARWDARDAADEGYAMPGVEGLSFSSPQTREVAQQVRPFIEKNTTRIEARAAQYRDATRENLERIIPSEAEELAPREGEVVVVAEADPQGSQVATDARVPLYDLLREHLGADAVVVRTISGDISSNGTVAEDGFVRDEAAASGEIPTVAVKGDHDSEATVEQLEDGGATVVDRTVEEVGGILVSGAADPAFKSLFGGLVNNDSGVTQHERGEDLRGVVEEEAAEEERGLVVVVHQPATAAGYLGVDAVTELDPAQERPTTPADDGIGDLPPGIVNIGHRHDAEPPRVVWNTDGSQVTWTVVNQLGTSGGVEETPTFNRFSTPFSTPLKDVTVQLQYVNPDTGLQTGYASIVLSPDGDVTVERRVDVGLPGGEPGDPDDYPGVEPPDAR